jgi:hypothetical protein
MLLHVNPSSAPVTLWIWVWTFKYLDDETGNKRYGLTCIGFLGNNVETGFQYAV